MIGLERWSAQLGKHLLFAGVRRNDVVMAVRVR